MIQGAIEMLEGLKEEIRYIRQRLDKHIDDQHTDFERIYEEISRVREETRAHKTKFSILASFIAVVVAGFVTWVTEHLKH